MSPLEIISRLCDVTENLSAIVKKQQTIIEQSKIEEAVRAELRQEVEETDREMDVLEYHMRKYCDTDDIEATEFGKENEHDRLEKGDRNTAGQAGGGRQDIVAVNGLPA